MNLLNLHAHTVEIYTFEKNNFIFKENLLSGAKSTKKYIFVYIALFADNAKIYIKILIQNIKLMTLTT